MKYQVNNDSLMHYGVLGMKWGVRNAETRAKYANREYKKALRGNTTYRKGQIKSEVGKDLSRKYMTEAKRASKAGDQKTYQKFMNKHDTERAFARRAPKLEQNGVLPKLLLNELLP